MSHKDWAKSVFALLFVLSIDFLTKKWGNALPQALDYQYLTFERHFNEGLVLGIFDGMPEMLSIFSAVLGVFTLSIYFFILYLVPIKAKGTRIGLSLIMGGILGNITDRVVYGHVIDFISFHLPNAQNYYFFNLADILQWPGYFIILKSVFIDHEFISEENNQRFHFWINRHFQMKYYFILLAVMFFISMCFFVFSYAFLNLVVHVSSQQLKGYLLTFTVIFLTFCILMFYVSKFLSHRTAGPIYALERFLKAIGTDSEADLKLRKDDDFKHLEAVAKDLRDKFKAK
jgi:signal peptidase II